MKHQKSIVLVALCLVLQSCSNVSTVKQSAANAPAGPTRLQSQIDSILDDPIFAPTCVGIKIVSLADGKILHARNSNKLFHPASNMKLLTTSTAVATLPGDFTFTTGVFSDQEIENGVLRGNIYIKGCGDPLMSTNSFDSLATSLCNKGIKSITGNLVGDVTYFDDIPWGSGWMWDDEPEAYEASITPLTVNDNAIHISVKAGRNSGDSLRYSVDHVTRFVSVVNRGTTSSDTLLPSLTVSRLKNENTITIQGRMKPSDPEQQFDLSVWRPELFFLELLKEKLEEKGIVVHGTAVIDSVRGSRKMAEVTHSLDSVLSKINKPSNNLAAENLLKTLAAEKHGVPGSAVAGLAVVKQYLSSLGIDTTAITLADGSGLSFYNLVSPDAMVQILRRQYDRQSTFKRFYESLPVAGVDGTLKNRMRHTRAEGNVHAKTGSISGVSTLSGYVTTADGKMLAFSIMANHFPGNATPLRNAQDKIMELLANYSTQSP